MAAPAGWFEEVIEARAYAHARARYFATENKAALAGDPFTALVEEFEYARAGERIRRRRAEAAGRDPHD